MKPCKCNLVVMEGMRKVGTVNTGNASRPATSDPIARKGNQNSSHAMYGRLDSLNSITQSVTQNVNMGEMVSLW